MAAISSGLRKEVEDLKSGKGRCSDAFWATFRAGT